MGTSAGLEARARLTFGGELASTVCAMMRIVAAIVVLLFALSGCVQGVKGMLTPFTAPDAEIVSSGPNDITIRTGGWTRPDKIAADFCQGHGKHAKFISQTRIGGKYTDDRLIYYRCTELET